MIGLVATVTGWLALFQLAFLTPTLVPVPIH